jgi:hypothetical protein
MLQLTKLLEGSSGLAPQEIRNIADSRVRDWGIHPDQAPMLKTGHTDADYQAFKQAEFTYLERKGIYDDLAADDLIDEEKRQRDYQSGRWAKPRYKTPYKAQSTTTLEGVADGIVSGKVPTTVTPTLMDALNSYLEFYAEKNIGGNARTIVSVRLISSCQFSLLTSSMA